MLFLPNQATRSILIGIQRSFCKYNICEFRDREFLSSFRYRKFSLPKFPRIRLRADWIAAILPLSARRRQWMTDTTEWWAAIGRQCRPLQKGEEGL
jgi:hypothetical protein